jgi:hypothetical protein
MKSRQLCEEKLYVKVGRKVPADRVEDRAAHVAEQLGEYKPKQAVSEARFQGGEKYDDWLTHQSPSR